MSFRERYSSLGEVAPARLFGMVKQMAREKDLSPAEFCEQILADYGHGLKLVELQDFAITPTILRKPQESLDILIKNFYSNRS